MKPERTLVCVIGQTRARQLTWPSFKKNVLDELQADLALVIHLGNNYDYSNPFWQHANYKWPSPEYEDWADGFDEAQRWLVREGPYPDWRKVAAVGSHWLGGIRVSGQPYMYAALIYFRWLLRHKIYQNGLLDRYDRFVITRSDYLWACPHPPLSVLPRENIWFPDGEYHAGITDRHMVVSGHHADSLNRDFEKTLGLIDDIVCSPDDLMRRFGGYSDFNIERYLHFQLKSHELMDRVRMFPYVMYTVRGDRDSHTDRTPGVWNGQMYIKSAKEYDSAMKWQQVLRIKADWERLAEEHPEEFERKAIRFGG